MEDSSQNQSKSGMFYVRSRRFYHLCPLSEKSQNKRSTFNSLKRMHSIPGLEAFRNWFISFFINKPQSLSSSHLTLLSFICMYITLSLLSPFIVLPSYDFHQLLLFSYSSLSLDWEVQYHRHHYHIRLHPQTQRPALHMLAMLVVGERRERKRK